LNNMGDPKTMIRKKIYLIKTQILTFRLDF
jgi:hypothetical protein